MVNQLYILIIFHILIYLIIYYLFVKQELRYLCLTANVLLILMYQMNGLNLDLLYFLFLLIWILCIYFYLVIYPKYKQAL